MSLIINKRHIILSALAVALGAAVFINWYYTKPEVSLTSEQSSVVDKQSDLGDAEYVNSDEVSEYFSEAKLKRSKTHDSQLEAINEIINSTTADDESKEKASQKLTNLVDGLKLESDIENLISAKLSCEALVIINNGKAEAVIEKVQDDASVLKVKEIILQNSDIKSENITVIEAKNS